MGHRSFSVTRRSNESKYNIRNKERTGSDEVGISVPDFFLMVVDTPSVTLHRSGELCRCKKNRGLTIKIVITEFEIVGNCINYTV